MRDLGKELSPEDIKDLVEISYGLWSKPTDDWHKAHFKHQTWNKGDIMYLTCRNLLENDVSQEDAEVALEEIYIMLQIPVRWPYCLNDVENDALTRREYKKSYRAFNNHRSETRKYRTQTGMTRDPYVYFFAACVEYDLIDYIEWTEIPFMSEGHLVYRTNLWAWRKALISGKRSRLYEFLEREPNHKEDYVNLLRWYRSQAYQKRVNQSSETT